MVNFASFTVLTALLGTALGEAYQIGVGRGDVTGPIDVTLMGYGILNQVGTGIHLRQFSRAFVIYDGVNYLAFVSVDIGMMGDGVRIEVIRQLNERFGVYNMDNVILSGTHTHAAPGGFLMHTLFDIPSLGFCTDTFDALVTGIVRSVEMAHKSLKSGRIYVSRGVLHEANINRSPAAYDANPPEEKKRYPHNVDKDFVQVRFVALDGAPIGVINWFAVHATSMNNTNTLISSDNVGYASLMFEKRMNPGALIGKGAFVASFASSNLGDVSPNIRGPKCHLSGEECDWHSKCRNDTEECYATGPGGDDLFESTRIIGERLFDKAWELWKGSSTVEITGPVKSIHQYVDMPKAETEIFNKTTGKMEKVKGCIPAMGYSAGAGTTDGPFMPFLKQGMNESMWWLDRLTGVVAKPTEEDVRCHAPKPILLATGRVNKPFEWQPSIVSTQLSFLGNLTLACVPGEFTTMSGRRLREAIADTMGGDSRNVVILGLCNTYSDYIATYEEYQVQRYEGASTLYGPHTLSLHLSQYRRLAKALMNNVTLGRGPEPQGLERDKMETLIPKNPFDSAAPLNFGDILVQPPKKVFTGDNVIVTFVSAHPKNDLRLEGTYLTVERIQENEKQIVATDANWETKMRWRLMNRLERRSQMEIEWSVPADTEPGTYRITHTGAFKSVNGQVFSFSGASDTFKVVRRANIRRRMHRFPYLTFF